jgi:hypothetical protein
LGSSQVRSASITSGGFRATLLATFSVPLITDVCVAAMAILRIFRVRLTDNQLALQARWETHCGTIMDIIEGCVVFPVSLLNIINACTQYYDSQNAVSNIRTDIHEPPPFTLALFSSTT